MVCHSLLQWTTFCQTSPPWPVHLGWPHRARIDFPELDKAVVRVIRLAGCPWLWFQSVCPLIPCLSAYRLTWASLTLDVGSLFKAVPAKRSRCPLPWRGVAPLCCRPWPWARGSSSWPGSCAIIAGRISITSDMQMTPPLWQKVKNYRAS